MIHLFPQKRTFTDSGTFTDPFRYKPHPLVREAAGLVMGMLEEMISRNELSEASAKGFREGKMLGVLVCSRQETEEVCFIAAFSGSVGGKSIIDGFVPPIYDLLAADGYFKKKEAEITDINRQIALLENSEEFAEAKRRLSDARSQRDHELDVARKKMTLSKAKRDALRKQGDTLSVEETLIRESQHEKAEFKRLKTYWDRLITGLQSEADSCNERICKLKRERAELSDALQEWIFRQYVVHNADGDEASVLDIFGKDGLTPPGGTGDCAAPKLLNYAYSNNLRPLAMGEFWYGSSPSTAVRNHGHFYPSCTSKCGPLLGFMLKGLKTEHSETPFGEPVIIHEDESIIITGKPPGMPSVPGLDGRISVQEWLCAHTVQENIHAVHRLDMDTSGVMVFAKDSTTAIALRRQFEEHSIEKTYLARLVHSEKRPLKPGEQDHISLSLNADYDERPRQKVDQTNGKEAITAYKVISINPDGTADVEFHPVTGRTHQLRVHSAHVSGLGRPILGDLLYCSPAGERLWLHASELRFTHPTTGIRMTFTCNAYNPFA